MGEDILISNLLEPGAMFQVTDEFKDNIFSPGSTGFLSFVRGIDESYQDIARILSVITRRGKAGKARLMVVNLNIPIFTIDHSGFKKLLPEAGSKKYFMHIERTTPMAVNIMKMSKLDFLGYGAAIAKRIKYMSDKCKHRKWPESKNNPINLLNRLPDFFEENPDLMMEKYANLVFREQFILESRRLISSLIRVHLQLEITRAKTDLNAAEFLLFANSGEFIPKEAEDKTNEYEFTKDNSMLKRTIDFYSNVKIEIQKLSDKKKK